MHGIAFAAAATVYVALVVPYSRLRSFVRRRRRRLPAVLWGPVPLITIRYWALAGRTYGYRSDSLVYRTYSINDRADFDYVLDDFVSRRVLGRLVPYLAWIWASLRYDVFCFFFDGGLLWETPFWRLELPLLKLAGKKIVVSAYGGDARLPSRARAQDRWNAYTDVPVGSEDRNEEAVRRRVAAFGRWADVVLGTNDLVEDLPRLDGVLRFALDLEKWRPVGLPPEDGIVTVVHASNHRHYKGTRFVIDAVERLRAEDLPVELRLVEGVPNDVAREIYAKADVVATDFLIGGCGVFAVEAMALGKPVLSYLRERIARFHPEWNECPIVNASPATLVDELRRLVVDELVRTKLAEQGPAYVRKYHSFESVGAQLDEIYRRLDSRRLRPTDRETASS